MRACGFTPHPVNFESSWEPRATASSLRHFLLVRVFLLLLFSSLSLSLFLSLSLSLALSHSLVLSAVARLIEREANYNHNLTLGRQELREASGRMADEVKHADDGRQLFNLDQTWRLPNNCHHLATRHPPKNNMPEFLHS